MPTFASKTAAALARHVRHNYSLELYGGDDRVRREHRDVITDLNLRIVYAAHYHVPTNRLGPKRAHTLHVVPA